MKKKNALWEFFASVKLAIFTFIALATTSIVGTVIQQNEPMSVYIEEYGQTWATIFKYLDIPDMYNSWWFLSLLILFSINLTVCSLERIPNVFRVINTDNLAIDPKRVGKMRGGYRFTAALPLDQAVARVTELLAGSGWKFSARQRDGGTLFFAEKGPWTRFGVYVVHVSILIIFLGAIIGSILGYKASVMIAEGTSTNQVYQRNEDHTPIPIGFDLKCARFELTYYDNGMPKDYLSDLVVTQDGRQVMKKTIEVNAPLQFAGLTFYQSSYQAIDGQFMVTIAREGSQSQQSFITVPSREMKWPAEKVSFGIVKQRVINRMGQMQHKIWFNDDSGSPVEFWAEDGRPVLVKRPDGQYRVTVKQRFATGLQVAKDPGVWWVYIGCILMVLGLMVVFFMAHRRVWVWVAEDAGTSTVVLGGNANKNKLGFAKDLEKIAEVVGDDPALSAS